jgi:hypothetical protein
LTVYRVGFLPQRAHRTLRLDLRVKRFKIFS